MYGTTSKSELPAKLRKAFQRKPYDIFAINRFLVTATKSHLTVGYAGYDTYSLYRRRIKYDYVRGRDLIYVVARESRNNPIGTILPTIGEAAITGIGLGLGFKAVNLAAEKLKWKNPHTEVVVPKLPKCDFCSAGALYDGKTILGPWAYMCPKHFRIYGIGLGLGKGQKLIEKNILRKKKPIREKEARTIRIVRDHMLPLQRSLGERLIYPYRYNPGEKVWGYTGFAHVVPFRGKVIRFVSLSTKSKFINALAGKLAEDTTNWISLRMSETWNVREVDAAHKYPGQVLLFDEQRKLLSIQ